MKNLSLIFNAVLSVAVIILFYLHFSSQNKQKEEVAAAPVVKRISTGNAVAPNILYVNSDSLWNNYEYVKKEKGDLEKEKLRLENQWQAKAKTLEKEIYDFQVKAQQGAITQEEGQRKEAELMQKQQELLQLKEELSAQLLNKEQEKNEVLQKAITEYLRKYNMDKNFSYVLGYTLGGGILYANDSLDITSEVIDGLNKEYKEKNKAKDKK